MPTKKIATKTTPPVTTVNKPAAKKTPATPAPKPAVKVVAKKAPPKPRVRTKKPAPTPMPASTGWVKNYAHPENQVITDGAVNVGQPTDQSTKVPFLDELMSFATGSGAGNTDFSKKDPEGREMTSATASIPAKVIKIKSRRYNSRWRLSDISNPGINNAGVPLISEMYVIMRDKIANQPLAGLNPDLPVAFFDVHLINISDVNDRMTAPGEPFIRLFAGQCINGKAVITALGDYDCYVSGLHEAASMNEVLGVVEDLTLHHFG
jgi:hypothetical protein